MAGSIFSARYVRSRLKTYHPNLPPIETPTSCSIRYDPMVEPGNTEDHSLAEKKSMKRV